MFLDDILNAGAIPALERTVQFAAQRQAIIAHNIANLDTPDVRPVDVSPAAFQMMLREAVERRRAATGGMSGPLVLEPTREIEPGAHALRLTPRTPSRHVLFHDRNNRDLERTMQDLAENASVHRIATDLLRARYQQLRDAMGERV